MKHLCATFSDTGHTVQTTKIGGPTQNTTENWTTKSWHFIYFRFHCNLYICNLKYIKCQDLVVQFSVVF